jgi:hypothetical protein
MPVPEHVAYQDTGCNLAPRCLTCPLPVCKYDSPWAAARSPDMPAKRVPEGVRYVRRLPRLGGAR